MIDILFLKKSQNSEKMTNFDQIKKILFLKAFLIKNKTRISIF